MNKPTTTQEQLEKEIVDRFLKLYQEGELTNPLMGSISPRRLYGFIEQELTTLIETTRKETEEIDTRVHNKSNMFWLERSEDVSGVSGTGVVADGIIFPGGVTVLNWRTAGGSTAVYKSIEDVQRIHGHDGKTKVYFPYQDKYLAESEEKSNK